MPRLSAAGAAFTELVLEVFRLNRLLLDAGDVVAAPAGLNSARWQVLGVVEHGPVTVPNVARTMGLTRQSVRETADSLARDGLIGFVDNPHHRRARLMQLTAKGRKALDVVVGRHASWANRTAGEERSLLRTVAALRELRARLEQDAAKKTRR
jgi:DNA-binding MarR family transcriptional regulator